ncbi:MAG: hypothetical protein JKY48_10260 [Flavobacteriales bacterium]|nr:hypothetical protein [Flavobacteriales bacterium]
MTVQKKHSLLLLIFLLSVVISSYAQEGWDDESDYSPAIELKQGIYFTFEEFKKDAPSITTEIEIREESLFTKDSINKWIEVDADKVWGCFLGSKLYISYEARFWKSLNMGSLMHFAVIDYKTVVQGDLMYGATVSQEPVSLQMFLDTKTGKLMKLNYRHLKPYIENEPSLVKYITKNKINKSKQTVLLLKAYNELHPVKLQSNE